VSCPQYELVASPIIELVDLAKGSWPARKDFFTLYSVESAGGFRCLSLIFGSCTRLVIRVTRSSCPYRARLLITSSLGCLIDVLLNQSIILFTCRDWPRLPHQELSLLPSTQSLIGPRTTSSSFFLAGRLFKFLTSLCNRRSRPLIHSPIEVSSSSWFLHLFLATFPDIHRARSGQAG
jgi:hypothetical protein